MEITDNLIVKVKICAESLNLIEQSKQKIY
jgi:hypothetical protein